MLVLAGLIVTTVAAAQHRIDPRWQEFIDQTHAQREGKVDSLAVGADDTIRYYVARVAEAQSLSGLTSAAIVRRLDEHHAIVRYPDPSLPNPVSGGVTDVQPANVRWKLSPPLLARHDTRSGRPTVSHSQPDGVLPRRFTVQGSDYFALKQELLRRNIPIMAEYPSTNTYTIETTYAISQQLLSLPELTFMDETTAGRQEESFLADPDIHVNRINEIHHRFPTLDGANQTVSIKEEAYDPADIDLRGRHVPNPDAASDISAHATDMATLLAGGGNTDPTSRGVARGARLTSSSFASLFPDTHYAAEGITVQNHSYGTQVESFYGVEAQAYDQSTQDVPSLLHVFSVGNSGQLTDSVGPYRAVPDFANLTGNYKQAKNILTVGAVNRREEIDSLISRGPAHDGRIKPELVAYSSDGSSGAAALVSGTAVLLQQAYQQRYDTPAPSALLKAILLNSAQDVGLSGPDFFSGYGNLDASRALQTLQNEAYLAVTLQDQQDTTLTLTVPPDARNLRVTLVWNDPAASPNSRPVLMNDLDLTLTQPSTNRRWFPWVLNPYPHPDSLQQPARRGVDRLNPVEHITVARPPAGEYQLRVQAATPIGPQPAYVAVQWDEAGRFRWTSPTGSDNVPQDGIGRGYFRWENTYDEATGQLAVSLNQGEWQTIDGAVDLSAEYYVWEPPSVFASARARMVVNGTAYLSDTFTISRSLQPAVGFSCGDSVLLQWGRVEEATGYTLYTLGEHYLEAVGTTQDTLAVVRPSVADAWYAVAPRLIDGEGIRSAALAPQSLGTGCYVSSFLAGINDRSEVSLLLDLGTTYQVTGVAFERWDGTTFQPLARADTVASTLQEYEDSTATQGLNEYRARLQLTNGQEVVTESASVYYLTDQPVLVFPNPVPSSQPLNVYTRTFDTGPARLTLYNDLGQPVLTQALASEREAVAVGSLLPGLYAYVVSVGNERFRGKIIVQ